MMPEGSFLGLVSPTLTEPVIVLGLETAGSNDLFQPDWKAPARVMTL